jgi:hypothetical protein
MGGGDEKEKNGRTSLVTIKEYYYTHYLVIALGAWYKPDAQLSDIPYDRKVVDGIAILLREMIELRYALDRKLSRSTRIIWRLNTHMGPIDEINSAGYNPKSFPHHQNWQGWGDPAVEAKWVAAFNDVIRAVAKAYGDLILVSSAYQQQHDTVHDALYHAVLVNRTIFLFDRHLLYVLTADMSSALAQSHLLHDVSVCRISTRRLCSTCGTPSTALLRTKCGLAR